jgi:predicted RNA-binding protein YlqC (UPF0109 family)
MIDITRRIAQALVDNADKVRVTEVGGGHTSILKINVGPGEAGKIIGKKGRTADALRTILAAIAAKEKKRVIIEIDSEVGHPGKMKVAAPAMGRAGRHHAHTQKRQEVFHGSQP